MQIYICKLSNGVAQAKKLRQESQWRDSWVWSCKYINSAEPMVLILGVATPDKFKQEYRDGYAGGVAVQRSLTNQWLLPRVNYANSVRARDQWLEWEVWPCS